MSATVDDIAAEPFVDTSTIETQARQIEVTLARPVPTRLTPWEENGIVSVMIPNSEYKITTASGLVLDIPMTEMRTFTRAVIPMAVCPNVDRAKFPWLFDIKQAIELGKRSPYALWLKDNAFHVWEEYGKTWAYCTASDVIGHYKLPEVKDQTKEATSA